MSGAVRGGAVGAVLAFRLAFVRGLIKGGEAETQAAEWGLMGAELN